MIQQTGCNWASSLLCNVHYQRAREKRNIGCNKANRERKKSSPVLEVISSDLSKWCHHLWVGVCCFIISSDHSEHKLLQVHEQVIGRLERGHSSFTFIYLGNHATRIHVDCLFTFVIAFEARVSVFTMPAPIDRWDPVKRRCKWEINNAAREASEARKRHE